MQKNIVLFLCSMFIMVCSYADTPTVVTTITIENHSRMSLALSGWSFGCGPPQQSRLAQDVQHCSYNGELYYDFIPPAATIQSGQSSSATVISYKNSAIFGRLGIQYVRSQFSKLGCGLVMDFDGDSIAYISLNPMIPQQAMTCELKNDGKNIIVLLR